MDEEQQRAYLVIHDDASLFGAHLDAETADQRARDLEGVLVEVPVIADYRPRTSSGTQAAEMGA